jgi:hypothetical protein
MSRQRRLSRVAVVALTLTASGKALLPAAAQASSRISYLPPPGPVVVFDLFESRQSVTISRRWTRCSASLLRRRSTSTRRKEWSLTTAPTCPPGGFSRKQRLDRDRLGLRNHAWCQPGTRHRTRRPHQPGGRHLGSSPLYPVGTGALDYSTFTSTRDDGTNPGFYQQQTVATVRVPRTPEGGVAMRLAAGRCSGRFTPRQS